MQKTLNLLRSHSTKQLRMLSYETLKISSPTEFVKVVELHRPQKYNAFNRNLWNELGQCFRELDLDKETRAIVVCGAGKHFTAGIDLMQMAEEVGVALQASEEPGADDVARRGRLLEGYIKSYQNSITSLEKCSKPVITAVHMACVGAGVDLITAADIRVCTKDAWFQVKEVDIGMAADVGSLQRLPRIIGNQSLVRELCYTARKVQSDEAKQAGIVSHVFENKEKMIEEAIKIAEIISLKSPVAVQNTKRNIVYSLEHTYQEGLDHICEINKLSLQSEDFINACIAQQTKGGPPVFSKL